MGTDVAVLLKYFSTENFCLREHLGNHYRRTHRVSQNFSVSQTSQHKHTKSARNPSLQIQLLFVLYSLFIPNLLFSNDTPYRFFPPLQIMSLFSETHNPNVLPYFIYYSICSTWWPADSLRNSLNAIFSWSSFILQSPEQCGYFGSL